MLGGQHRQVAAVVTRGVAEPRYWQSGQHDGLERRRCGAVGDLRCFCRCSFYSGERDPAGDDLPGDRPRLWRTIGLDYIQSGWGPMRHRQLHRPARCSALRPTINQYGHVTIQSNSGGHDLGLCLDRDGGQRGAAAAVQRLAFLHHDRLHFSDPLLCAERDAGQCRDRATGAGDALSAGGTTVFVWQCWVCTAHVSRLADLGCCATEAGCGWLSALPNRIDSSMSNNLFTFSPTGPDGTVADNNGISFYVQCRWYQQPSIGWSRMPGIVCGTDGGEWLVPNAAPPLTPSNISAARVDQAELREHPAGAHRAYDLRGAAAAAQDVRVFRRRVLRQVHGAEYHRASAASDGAAHRGGPLSAGTHADDLGAHERRLPDRLCLQARYA